jgi:hypothetical protein
MVDSQHAFASWFLWISAVGFSLAFALPLLFVPLSWARIFQWRVPDETHLTIYFGPCVGALAATIVLPRSDGRKNDLCRTLADDISALPSLPVAGSNRGCLQRCQGRHACVRACSGGH